MAEQIILDPADLVSSSRTELDITPWLNQSGIDWGDAAIESYVSESQRGAVPVDYRVPNREISGGLMFAETQGGTTTTQARTKIQAKLALFQREGGWIKRITNGGGTVYADVVDATFRATSVEGWASRADADLNASFSISCLPDFYGDEQDLGDNSTTTAAELIFTETGVEGDYPGRVRIVVDEDDSDDQRGLIWCFRSRHYNSATTASMEYEAEELANLDTATKTVGTSVYGTASSGMWSGGTIVHHGTISTSWTPALGTNIGGTSYLTHTGTYQVFGRLASTSGTTVQARFVYDVGDLVNPVENAPWRFPGGGTAGATSPYIADLGEIRLDPAPVGTHRWQGQVQFKGDAGGETGSVDKLWIVNKDEGMGRLSAPLSLTEGLISYSARSEFTTESGAITSDSLAVGGTWTGAGDAVDFSESSDTAVRTEVSDAANTGRYVTASTPTLTATLVRVDFKYSNMALKDIFQGVVARYTDTSNYLIAGVGIGSDGQTGMDIRIKKRVAGTVTELLTVSGTSGAPSGLYITNDTWFTVALMVDALGRWFVWLYPRGFPPGGPLYTGQDSVLATGGTLASGKVGIYDEYTAASARTRTYDNFAAWVPTPDAVMFSGQSAQLTTDGMYREDSGGTAYGPVSQVIGDLPRIPVAGLEGRTTEVFLKATRGDLDQLADPAIDDISARAFYRPSWLFVDDS